MAATLDAITGTVDETAGLATQQHLRSDNLPHAATPLNFQSERKGTL